MLREFVLEPFHSDAHLQIDCARELNPQQLAAITAPVLTVDIHNMALG